MRLFSRLFQIKKISGCEPLILIASPFPYCFIQSIIKRIDSLCDFDHHVGSRLPLFSNLVLFRVQSVQLPIPCPLRYPSSRIFFFSTVRSFCESTISLLSKLHLVSTCKPRFCDHIFPLVFYIALRASRTLQRLRFLIPQLTLYCFTPFLISNSKQLQWST